MGTSAPVLACRLLCKRAGEAEAEAGSWRQWCRRERNFQRGGAGRAASCPRSSRGRHQLFDSGGASDSVHRQRACSLVANRDEIPQVQFLDRCSSAAGCSTVTRSSALLCTWRLRRLLKEFLHFYVLLLVVTEILELLPRAASGSHFPQCSCDS